MFNVLISYPKKRSSANSSLARGNCHIFSTIMRPQQKSGHADPNLIVFVLKLRLQSAHNKFLIADVNDVIEPSNDSQHFVSPQLKSRRFPHLPDPIHITFTFSSFHSPYVKQTLSTLCKAHNVSMIVSDCRLRFIN